MWVTTPKNGCLLRMQATPKSVYQELYQQSSLQSSTLIFVLHDWLVVLSIFYYPFHIWDVILPIDFYFFIGVGTTRNNPLVHPLVHPLIIFPGSEVFAAMRWLATQKTLHSSGLSVATWDFEKGRGTPHPKKDQKDYTPYYCKTVR